MIVRNKCEELDWDRSRLIHRAWGGKGGRGGSRRGRVEADKSKPRRNSAVLPFLLQKTRSAREKERVRETKRDDKFALRSGKGLR